MKPISTVFPLCFLVREACKREGNAKFQRAWRRPIFLFSPNLWADPGSLSRPARVALISAGANSALSLALFSAEVFSSSPVDHSIF